MKLMLDELKEESIVNKVGGRFKLSTLIQKRLVQLNAGSRALVDVDTHDKMQVVLQEIVQDKIYLDPTDQVRVAGAATDPGSAPDFLSEDL
jgi:DNA-directed RNA polymerase subunit omega